jgi:hypothetical protein
VRHSLTIRQLPAVGKLHHFEIAPTEAESKAAVRKAATPTSMLNGKVTILSLPAQTTPPGSGRLGLADLKRAALERRARQEAGAFPLRASALPSAS